MRIADSKRSLQSALPLTISQSSPFFPKAIHKTNVLTLFTRMFEAHFLPVHLVVTLAASSVYEMICPMFLTPQALRFALEFSAWCRFLGFCLMLCFFYRYEQYHQLCVGLRREEMRLAGLLVEMEENDDFSPNVFLTFGIAEAALFPLGGFLYGAIPGLHAVMTHLFTDRLTYVVSLKPRFANRNQQADAA